MYQPSQKYWILYLLRRTQPYPTTVTGSTVIKKAIQNGGLSAALFVVIKIIYISVEKSQFPMKANKSWGHKPLSTVSFTYVLHGCPVTWPCTCMLRLE